MQARRAEPPTRAISFGVGIAPASQWALVLCMMMKRMRVSSGRLGCDATVKNSTTGGVRTAGFHIVRLTRQLTMNRAGNDVGELSRGVRNSGSVFEPFMIRARAHRSRRSAFVES